MEAKQPLRLDSGLLFAIFTLLGIGLVMVLSSSIVVAQHNNGNCFYFFNKQAIFAIGGIVAMIGVLYVPTRFWEKFGSKWLIIAFVLLVLVLIPGIGVVVNGSRRWIQLGPIAIQVSELVKLCGVMYMSHYLLHYGQSVRAGLEGVIKPMAVLGILGILLLLEPDFGATVVLFTTVIGMMFVAGVQVRWFSLLIVAAAIAVVGLVIFSPYRLARLTGFLHPWDNQLDTGYQLTQALMAFGRGGWFGVGLGNSVQKLFYLPEAHTDFVLAIIAEELGFIGVIVLLALFGLLVWRGLTVARRAHIDKQIFDAYLAYGVTFWLGLQVVVNVGVNIGLLPTKGLTLPFISYGGSSLVVDCIASAMLLRVDYQNKVRGCLSRTMADELGTQEWTPQRRKRTTF